MTASSPAANNWSEQERAALTARIAVLLREKDKLEKDKHMALEELSKVVADNLKANQSLPKKVAQMPANNKNASTPTQSQGARTPNQLESRWRPTQDVAATNAEGFYQQENQKLKEQNRLLATQAANAKQEAWASEQENQELKKENSLLSTEAANAKQEAQKSEQEKNAVTAELDKTSDELRKEREQNEKLRADAATGRKADDDLQEEREKSGNLRNEVAASKNFIKTLCGNNQGLSKELDTNAKKLAQQRLVSSLLKTGLIHARQDNAGLHQTISKLKGRLGVHENTAQENVGLHRTISYLHGRLRVHGNAAQENIGLHKTISQFWCQLGEQRAENSRLNMTIKHKDDRCGELLSSVKSLQGERDSAVRDKVAAEEKAKVQADRIDVLERDLASANQAVEQKDAAHAKLAEELAVKTNDVGVLQSKRGQDKRILKNLMTRKKDLRTKVRDLKEELSTANSTVEWLTSQVELHEKSARQTNSDFKALSSLLSQVQDANEATASKVWQQDQQISQDIPASC